MSIVAIVSKYADESFKIAEFTALRLGYRLVTMDDLIKAAAKDYNTPEKDFSQVVKDQTLWHHLFRKKKLKLVSLLEQKLCQLMGDDQMVFCDYLGYPIFQEISHVLKVLVLAHPETGKTADATTPQAQNLLSNNGVAGWFEKIYHADMEDPNLYDLTPQSVAHGYRGGRRYHHLHAESETVYAHDLFPELHVQHRTGLPGKNRPGGKTGRCGSQVPRWNCLCVFKDIKKRGAESRQDRQGGSHAHARCQLCGGIP